jgi:hypothetical protein
MGAVAVFFQDVASFIFRYPIQDPMITRYWGGVLLALAVFYLFLSMDPEKYQIFIWVGVFDLGITMIVTIIHISLKTITWLQGFTAIFINPIFIVLLLYGLAKEPKGEVVFVAGNEKKPGKPEQELPAHVHGEHPLHGK